MGLAARRAGDVMDPSRPDPVQNDPVQDDPVVQYDPATFRDGLSAAQVAALLAPGQGDPVTITVCDAAGRVLMDDLTELRVDTVAFGRRHRTQITVRLSDGAPFRS